MDRPSIGRIVHYVHPKGKHYPAIITTVWSDTCVNLHVFNDGSEPLGVECLPNPTSVCRAEPEEGETHTWHWPERI